MKISLCNILPVFELCLILCVKQSICGGRFNEEGYYASNYNDNQEVIAAAIQKLEDDLKWVNNWPSSDIQLGQVSGLAIDNAGRLLVFHRASHIWDATTFNERNVYNFIGIPAIKQPTIIVVNETGEVLDQWGQNLFFIPHGITVDKEDNVWVTDVAMHQVLKFTPDNRVKPALVLGSKFIPGEDDTHFCKPSAVAVLPSGDFFVADGYCNHRIVKFSKNGNIILQWGTNHGSQNFRFNVPHALTLAEDRGLVCVADRERGRVACFRHDNGSYVSSYSNWLIGGRLFSVAYAPAHGGRLYIVNGPGSQVPVRGYVIDFASGRLIQTFAPDEDLRNPHDIVVTPDGVSAYVAELSPFKVHKFVDEGLRNESLTKEKIPVKPTATVEVVGSNSTVSGGAWEWWSGAAGGAGGAAAAALLALAALALLRARNTGKGVEAEPLVP